MYLLAGTSHPTLVTEVCALAKVTPLKASIVHFPDGEIRVHVSEEVRGKECVILQTLGRKPNEYLVETFLMADALRRVGAGKITLMCPYLAYSRQNLPEQDGASLAARLFAYFLHKAGISELVAVDLHAEHIPSFYDFPVGHVSGLQPLVDALRKKYPNVQPVVVGPDLGSAKLVARYADALGTSFALIQKKRLDAQTIESLSLVGEVEGKDVLLADDMVSTACTLTSAAKVCREKGAKRIFACVTHGLFTLDAIESIQKSEICELFVTNTVPQEPQNKITCVSIASTLAAALHS